MIENEALRAARPEIPGKAVFAEHGAVASFTTDRTARLMSSKPVAAARSEQEAGAAYVRETAESDCSRIRAENPAVEVCEPNYVYSTDLIPGDPQYGNLWGLSKIHSREAWDITTGSREVLVAVVDTGVDYSHPDLIDNIWTNPGEIAGNGVDDDRNGFIDDMHGANLLNRSGDPYDDNSHGTHVSGTIGAAANNGTGVVGVNWKVRIMGVKFLGAGGGGTLFGGIQAIHYAVAQGAQIINASWGGAGYSQALYDEIKAAGQAGVLFVAAAGNNGLNSEQYPNYPAAYNLDNIISVAATDRNDALAYFSNYGRVSVDLAAPGVSILSTVPQGGYASYSGTSMATPHVAGVAALVKAVFPEIDYATLKARILAGGDTVSRLIGKTVTGKRLSAVGTLLSNARPGEDQPEQPSEARITGVKGPGGSKYVFRQAEFSLGLSGRAGEVVPLSMTLYVDTSRRSARGRCSLGSAVVGPEGIGMVNSTMKLSGLFKGARRATFRSPANRISVDLRNLRGARKARLIRKTGSVSLRQSLTRTCREIKSAFISSY